MKRFFFECRTEERNRPGRRRSSAGPTLAAFLALALLAGCSGRTPEASPTEKIPAQPNFSQSEASQPNPPSTQPNASQPETSQPEKSPARAKSSATAEARGEIDAALREFAAHMDKLAEDDRFSDVVLLAKDGKPVFEKAYGMADKGGSVPNRTDTKFNLDSVSKMFTGVAIARLAEAGKLSFDDPVGRHVAGLPAEIADKVTIEHLLTHTSDLGDFMSPEYHARKDSIRTIPEFMRFVVNQPLLFEPGSAHLYSNAGYVLLGAVIESVTGQSYYDYIRDHVAIPAGMENTDFYEKDGDTLNLARGYFPAGNGIGFCPDRYGYCAGFIL